jgi:hypothetical protein
MGPLEFGDLPEAALLLIDSPPIATPSGPKTWKDGLVLDDRLRVVNPCRARPGRDYLGLTASISTFGDRR